MTGATRVRVVVGSLALFAVLGTLAVTQLGEQDHAGALVPSGLATGALIVTTRRWRWACTAAVLAVATAVAVAGGRSVVVAAGFAVAMTTGCAITARLLTAGTTSGRPRLENRADMIRYLGATAAGALVTGGTAGVAAVLIGWGEPAMVALAVTVATWMSQLLITPYFHQLSRHRRTAGPLEHVVQWTTVLVITPLVFASTAFPSMVFLVLPLLAWGAWRLGAREALVQVSVAVSISAALTTAGVGPMTMEAERYGLLPEVDLVMLQLFMIACLLVVVPLVLSVSEHGLALRDAAGERDLVAQIVDSARGVGIIGTDPQGRITLFNPGAQDLLGYTPAEVMGRSTAIFHTDEAIRAKARELGVPGDFVSVARAMAQPGTGAQSMRFRRKDGEEREHRMTLTEMVDDRGGVRGYVATTEDITQRVQTQRALVEALSAERLAVERLTEVDRVKDAFVSSVSHELRTPLTSILVYLELLEEGDFGKLNPEQVDAITRVSVNTRRLLSLINDLLTLSEVEEVGIRPVDTRIDLAQVVRNGYDVVAPAAAGRDLSISLDLPLDELESVGDAGMLERVVVNIVGNAVKFTPDGGRISVSLRDDHGTAVLTVTDTGLGIAPAEQGEVFTRFFRSQAAQTRAIPGSGLGLSISHSIVEAHGGSIEVESAPGTGTTMRVRLPRQREGAGDGTLV